MLWGDLLPGDFVVSTDGFVTYLVLEKTLCSTDRASYVKLSVWETNNGISSKDEFTTVADVPISSWDWEVFKR